MPNQTISLRIYGIPIAKGRHQTTVPIDATGMPYRAEKTGRIITHQFSPKKTKDWEKEIKRQAKPFAPGFLWDGAIRADVEFVFPRDTQVSLKRHYHTVKPDKDNLEKLFMDALHGIIFTGDQRVCAGFTFKRYTRPGEEPGIIAKFTLLS